MTSHSNARPGASRARLSGRYSMSSGRENLSTMPTDVLKEQNIQKRWHTGVGLVSNMFCFLFSFHLCAGFFIIYFCMLWNFFFFVARGSSGLGVGGRDGEQASCLDAKLFWQASADFQLFNRSNWLTGSIHEETILPRGSFRFQHDGMDENCTIGTDKEWKRYILTSPGLKKICYY